MLHIVVCLKQVPDSAQIRVHPVTNTIMRQGVPSVINPYDLFALEEALRLKDKVGAAQVTVLTMGPPMAEDSLRKALAYGADRAVLLTDRQFAGSDTLATTYALASGIRKIGETWGLPHVVFTGKQTIDGDTAQVGPGIAKRLNYNQLTYVSHIASFEPEAGSIMVERRAEGGVQVLTTRLPVLMTMLEDCNEIRRGTMDDALRAAQAEVIPDLTKCGLRGSPTVVKKVFAPTPRAEKAHQIPVTGRSWPEMAGDMIDTIFTRCPGLETDLLARTENF
jgi:electron transfer flavoprotein beta subunit